MNTSRNEKEKIPLNKSRSVFNSNNNYNSSSKMNESKNLNNSYCNCNIKNVNTNQSIQNKDVSDLKKELNMKKLIIEDSKLKFDDMQRELRNKNIVIKNLTKENYKLKKENEELQSNIKYRNNIDKNIINNENNRFYASIKRAKTPNKLLIRQKNGEFSVIPVKNKNYCNIKIVSSTQSKIFNNKKENYKVTENSFSDRMRDSYSENEKISYLHYRGGNYSYKEVNANKYTLAYKGLLRENEKLRSVVNEFKSKK